MKFLMLWYDPSAFVALMVGMATLVSNTMMAQAQLPESVIFTKEMVVSASSLATKAGEDVLAKGGTAADAMIAVQTVLGLVEPQSSGISGGAFFVWYDGKEKKITTIDAREKAPSAATEDRFVEFADFFTAWQTGLAVGVSGVPKLLEYAYDKYGGEVEWEYLFKSAIDIAEGGFEITERMNLNAHELLELNEALGYECPDDKLFFRDPTASEYFLDGCEPKAVGTPISNPNYAKLMKGLAEYGSDFYYYGDVAEAIVEAVATDLNVPGDLSLEDLASYELVEREPVCCEYKTYDVCGMGPPASGALAICQQLGMLETFDDFAESGDLLDEKVVHRVAVAGKLAFADRGLYVGDADFVTVPVEGMIDKEYLKMRALLIGEEDIDGPASPGEIPGFDPTKPADGRAKNMGTSHISIADQYGNVLSMTTTIESFFGNGVMVPDWGFLLNNQITDFSFDPGPPENPIANRVQANKRPRSSMSPTIILDKYGTPFLATGSPGGSRIIGYVFNTITGIIDFGLDPQEVINHPHYLNRNGDTELESLKPGVNLDYDIDGLTMALEARGHVVSIIGGETSGLSLIEKGDGVFIGGADKRRDGTVGGSNYKMGGKKGKGGGKKGGKKGKGGGKGMMMY
mmetsp:Transcript_9825/g.23734  ORF Transcript_9825/g.23734 Transcript_9825/m.23734 type:complete len:630 (-) Transcript_9825:122-2011(-)